MVELGLHCCARAFSSCASRGLLTVVASIIAEHRLYSLGLVAAAPGLAALVAQRIFPDRGSNLYSLHWQVDP